MAVTFWIDIEDAAGQRQGSGPITSASFWRYTARMDRAGSFEFEMPATDGKAFAVARKRIARAYTQVDGQRIEVGAGIIDRIERVPQPNGDVRLRVAGDDLIRELTYRSVHTLKLEDNGEAISHAAAVAAVAAYAPPGWTITPDAAPPHDLLYGAFRGESVLAALVQVAERSRSHFYRGTGREIVFTSTFAPSGVRAQRGLTERSGNVCAIAGLQERFDTYDLMTRIYPRGSGNADVQLTLQNTTRSAPPGFTLNAAQNYIENDAAVAAYGLIERQVDYREIGPVSNTDADLQAASNALFDVALETLRRYSDRLEQAVYDVEVAECPVLLRPMQSIHVDYRDTVAGLTVNQALNILEATWRVDASGLRTTALVVTDGDTWPDSDVGTLVESIAQGRVYQALPQLSANSYVTAYQKNVDRSNHAAFRFRFGAEVVQVQQVLFEFQLLDFEATVRSVAGRTSTSSSGGGTTATSSSGGGTTATSSSGGGTTATSSSGGGITATSSSGGGTTVSSSNGGGTTATSSSGGGTTVSSSDGGGTTATSSSGGGTTVSSSSGGGITATSSSGGGTTVSSSDGGGTTATSSSGGGTTATSSSGGGITATSSSGGGTTVSSSNGGGTTATSSSGGGTTATSAGGSSHSHNVTIPNHTHNVTVPNHTHGIPIYRLSSADPSNRALYHQGSTNLIGVFLTGGGTYDVASSQSGGGTTVSSASGGGSVETSSWESSHTHQVTIPNHTHQVAIPDHTHDVTVPDHSHDVTVPNHTHDVVILDHTHDVTIPDHTHDVTILDHTHEVTIPDHTHDVVILDHTHQVTIPDHTHDVTILDHTHQVTIPNHTHEVTVPDHSHDVTVPNHTHDVVILDHTHEVAIPDHTHDVTILDHTHEVTIPDHTHDVVIPNHTHNVTVPNHTHDVTILDHEHTVTANVAMEYGVYREDSIRTYALDELEYRVNGGAWASLAAAVDQGDGWYALDITAQVVSSTVVGRPLQTSNVLEVRGMTSKDGKLVSVWYWDAINEVAYFDFSPDNAGVEVGDVYALEGTNSLSSPYDFNADGIIQITNTAAAWPPDAPIKAVYLGTNPGEQSGGPVTTPAGTVTFAKTVTIDAQLSVRNVIQAVALA